MVWFSLFTTANIGGYKDYYFSCELTSGEDVSLIAPEPISKTKPIVKVLNNKEIIAKETQNSKNKMATNKLALSI